MPETGADSKAQPEIAIADPPRLRRRRWRILAGLVALLLVSVWALREDLAGRVIEGQLTGLGLPATYEIVSIGPRRQVLKNVVVGDPKNPDFTAERIESYLQPRLGVPALRGVTLVRPRLYGTYRNGKLSFGSLDKVLFGGPEKAFELPKLNLRLVDGRARLTTDYGPVGFKAQGQGELRGGFAGVVAAAAPALAMPDCSASDASLYGALTIAAASPAFKGPLRLGRADCPKLGLALGKTALELDARLADTFDAAAGKARLAASNIGYGASRAAGFGGTLDFNWRGGDVSARYDLAAAGVQTPQLAAAMLGGTGTFATRDKLARIEGDGSLRGEGLRPGTGLDAALALAQDAAADSLLAPMLGQIRATLAREGRASRFAGDFTARQEGGALTVMIPQAQLTGASGETLLALSRFQYSAGAKLAPVLAGDFVTGGPGLPRLQGQVARGGGGSVTARLAMAEYRAAGGRLALPELIVVQNGDGGIGFAGTALLSGPLPGGAARDLVLPLDGNWSSARGLSVWRHCTALRFSSLSYANLTLDNRALTLCPGPEGAIVRSDGRGTRLAAGAPSLDVSGRLGTTPIHIASGPVGFAIPGALAARRLDIALGPAATATRFRIDDLTAKIGKDIAGRFAGSDVHLFAVPMDLLGASGAWRYAGGKLSIDGADFTLQDRRAEARFQPLSASGATLTLFDNRIDAKALLREPRTAREVVAVDIAHSLASGVGHADLTVSGILFDAALQPATLTRNALGVIANASGTVRGTGRIDWTARGVTSGGSFTTDNFDFAAAFGPVKGASGTVVFTDLINLVTAPDQQLRVASINPGIEVNDGVITFQLEPGNILQLQGGAWPFLGGTMRLRPVRMSLGIAETRRYVLEIEGLDAARFIERMEVGNISATGIFDGTLPLVFDENGGRIEGGLLKSRGGGNVSYIGALTYENMGAMANFAFQALRDLDYNRMNIAMDGQLEGEIVTRVRFDGVRQGMTAKRNFITQRFANLPIQFNVNVKAPFYQLITSFKAMYDPAFVKDPRTLGLFDANGRPIKPEAVNPPPPPIRPSDIQPSDSRK
ncbi:MAG: intermembrane phospholipid transport protein YdbH family protein [Novosphingobium sp.]